MKKLNHWGFNLYKKAKFWFVVDEKNEAEAVKKMLAYVNANKGVLPQLDNGNVEDYTFKQFKNHSSEGFELKNLKDYE